MSQIDSINIQSGNNSFSFPDVGQAAGKAVRWIKDTSEMALLFITRYFGSKEWSLLGVIKRIIIFIFTHNLFQSGYFKKLKQYAFGHSGYHYNAQMINPNDAKKFLRFAAVAASCNKGSETIVKPFKLKIEDCSKHFEPGELKAISKDLKIDPKCLWNIDSPIKVMLYSDEADKTLYVAFGVVDSLESFTDTEESKAKIQNKQMGEIVGQLAGRVSESWLQAEKIVHLIKSKPQFQGKKIYLVGFCSGGSQAQLAALKEQVNAVCFNTCPLGAGLQQYVGNERLSEADSYVTHVSAKNDYVSNSETSFIVYFLNLVDYGFSHLVGLRTPANFGKRYLIPSAYKDLASTHLSFLSSLTQYCGYTKFTKTFEMNDSDLQYATNADPVIN